MTTLIGIAIWLIIFCIWFWKTYPEKARKLLGIQGFQFKWPARKRKPVPKRTQESAPQTVKKRPKRNYKSLVAEVEKISAKESMDASEAAALVEAVMEIMEIEPASGQIWEAYALDTLERAHITCGDCGRAVQKTVKKTGVHIQCVHCKKELALRNSKVTVIDPSRADLEDWEKPTRH